MFIYLLIAHISGEGCVRALADKAIKSFSPSILTSLHTSTTLTISMLVSHYLEITKLAGFVPSNTLTGDYLNDIEIITMMNIQSHLQSQSSLSWSEWLGIIILTRLSSPSERIYKSGVCLWRRLIQCGIACRLSDQVVHEILNGNFISLSCDNECNDDDDDEQPKLQPQHQPDKEYDNDNDNDDGVIVGEKEVQRWLESPTEEVGVEKVLTLLSVIWNEEEPCIPLSSLLFLLKYVTFDGLQYEFV